MNNTYERKNADKIISNQMENLAEAVSKAKWEIIKTNECIDNLENYIKEFSEVDIKEELFPDLGMIHDLGENLVDSLTHLINKCEEQRGIK